MFSAPAATSGTTVKRGRWVLDDMQSLYYSESSRSPSPQPYLEVQPPKTRFRRTAEAYEQELPALLPNLATSYTSWAKLHNLAPSRPSFVDSYPEPILEYPCGSPYSLQQIQHNPIPFDGWLAAPAESQFFLSPETTVGEILRDVGQQPTDSLPDTCSYIMSTEVGNDTSTDQKALQAAFPVHESDDQPRRDSSLDTTAGLFLDQTFTRTDAMCGLVMGFQSRLPITCMDRYLVAMRQILKRCRPMAATLKRDLQRVLSVEGVLWIVREAWPRAESFWDMTTCLHGFMQSEMWRNFPCWNSYSSLSPAYRPTKLQLLVPHSPIIDWLPWPDLRDLIIKHQDEVDIDAVCRYAILTMVAHRRPRRIEGKPEGTSKPQKRLKTGDELESFRIWDLTLLEGSLGSYQRNDHAAKTTAPSRSASITALKKAFDLVYDDFATLKLENRFFDQYPVLHCSRLVSDFKIRSLEGIQFCDVGSPTELSYDAVLRFKSRVESVAGMRVEL